MTGLYYEQDQTVLERVRQRSAAEAYRQQTSASITPDFTDLLARYQQAYPDMEAGVMLGLARAGIDPSSEEAQAIGDADFEKQRKEGIFDSIGDVIGGGFRVVGAPLGVAGRAIDDAMGGVDESIIPGIKGTIRTGMVVLESPLQELQTFIRAAGWTGVRLSEEQGDDSIANRIRNIVDPTRWDDNARVFADAYPDAGSSSLREIMTHGGENIDLGTGFLPGGEVEDTVKRRANRLTLKVNDAQFGGPGNPSITTGRITAAKVAEPGTAQFNALSGLVDAGVAWFGDPSSAALGAAKGANLSMRAGRAQRALRSEGLAQAGRELVTNPSMVAAVDRSYQARAAENLGDVAGRLIHPRGGRNTVDLTRADEWLTKGGRTTVERIAETGSFYDLWQATGKKMGVDLTRRLAEASTPQDVMSILRPALGTEMRHAPEFVGFKAARANRQGVRLLQGMPGSFLDPEDMDEMVEQADRWLRNAKVPPELRKEAVETLAQPRPKQELVTVVGDIMGKVADDLAERIKPGNAATTKARARELTRMWNDDIEKTRSYFSDEIVENRKAAGIQIGGNPVDVQSPFLFTEYLNNLIPLPEAREIRRATSSIAKLVDNPFFDKTVGALDAVQSNWKRMVLLRGAYTVRVIGEEQVRMASSGLDSMFAHPMSFIASLVSGDGKLTKHLGGKAKQSDLMGDAFFEGGDAVPIELQRALNKGWAGWVDGKTYDRNFTMFKPEDDGYQRAWASSIGHLHTDPVARRVAGGNANLDEVKEWFFTEKGRKFRTPLVEAHPELATRAGADRYIDTLWEGVQYRTGSDPVLLEAIATGRIAGEKIGKTLETGRWVHGDVLDAHLETVIGPDAVVGQRVTSGGRGGGLGEAWDNGTGWAFSYLNTKPTNYLSRSQTFRQKYWQRIEEMVPYMDDTARAETLKRAEGVVDDAALKRMRQAPKASPVTRTKRIDNGSGGFSLVDEEGAAITDLESADTLAKAYGLDETKKLLYDMTDRGQFFDAMRLVFPFGEAWKEVLTRWTKIGMENPRVIRRGQQVVTGARGSGFFHKDVNGEEVFTYPFSRQLSKALIGMPVDLNARVAGLSLMTEVLPGVGPVMQIPAAAIIPETPDWDWARKVISPYGEPDTSGGMLEAFFPGYAKNIMSALGKGDDRLMANSVGATMDYLASTGEYDLANSDDVRRLNADATHLAKNVYFLRSIVQFGAPSSPQPEYLVKDKDGDLAVARVIIEDFYKMQEEDYDTAPGRFLERYGKELFTLMQAKTFSVAPRLPVSKASAEWERSNKDLVGKYGNTWGFFAPTGDSEDFDYQAYVRQFERGDRVSITPEQRLALAQARVGRHIYEQAQAKVSDRPSTAEREWLAAIKERIREEYPGFGEMVPGLPARAEFGTIVEEIQSAIADPKLSAMPQARAARLYLAARERALAFAQEQGVTTLEAMAAQPAREWLANVGQQIASRYPEFQEMFDVVFSREVDG